VNPAKAADFPVALEPPAGTTRRLLGLALAAIGVVYGDIGTSPLYALRECFHGQHRVPASEANVMGVLCLVFWSLVLIVSVKYLTLVMRADSRGEGGILALLGIASPQSGAGPVARKQGLILALGVFGRRSSTATALSPRPSQF